MSSERLPAPPPRGRYAPSPTGEIHLGNASTALVAWLSARTAGGSFVMRMEDLDANRVRAGLAERILEDLEWMGLDWDEGPDRGGPHAPYDQGSRTASYDAAFERLREAGTVYPCFCSRKDILSAASAPQEPGEEVRYPGTCRELPAGEAERRIAGGARHAWRFRVAADATPTFRDRVHGEWGAGLRPPGDFVVRRSDDVPAYQLAVVVDDDAMGITEVVRGDDLLSSTIRQRLLYRALGRTPPAYAHVPLLLGADGVRLSKRHRGVTLRELREGGMGPGALVGRLAWVVGLLPRPEAVSPADLTGRFSWSRVARRPGGIVVEPASW